MKILEVKDLRKSFNKTEVLKGVDFSLEEGQVLAIIGSSGSGKTTLLRCINFLEDADKGQIFNKFYQGDTSRRQDGSGLGLALVKKILESQNGTVHFENNNEGGCTFFVTLTEDL